MTTESTSPGFTISTKIHRRTVVEFIHSDGRRSLIPVTMRWNSSDPHAVQLLFKNKNTVKWITGRDLLAEGLHFPAGEGDVRVAPDKTDPEWLSLTLDSPAGFAEFRVPADALAEFLADTFNEVPMGAEVTDAFTAALDAAITEFLSEHQQECDDDWWQIP